MITKKEINFDQCPQSNNFVSLDVISRSLVNLLRRYKSNTSAYKLDFSERMLNFVKLIGLEVLSNHMFEDYLKPVSKISEVPYTDRMRKSLLELLFHFGIISIKKKGLKVNSSFQGLIDKQIVKKIVKNSINGTIASLTKKQQEVVNDFLFVKDLIDKYDNPEHKLKFVKDENNVWGTRLKKGKMDYELRLCKTLYHLIHLQIPKKIESPFDEDFYIESGQNAFENFTGPLFIKFFTKIIEGKKNANVFDLGCGYGNYLELIHKSFPDFSLKGLEINTDVCIQTQEKFKAIETVEIENKDFFKYSGTKKYDIILMNYVLYYFNLEEKMKVFEKAKRLLNDNGSIIICQYFSGIEILKKQLAKKQKDYSMSRKIEMYYSDKFLYASTLWNDVVDNFSEAATWNEFHKIISELDLQIESMTHADRFYYSLFVEIKKK